MLILDCSKKVNTLADSRKIFVLKAYIFLESDSVFTFLEQSRIGIDDNYKICVRGNFYISTFM